MTKPEIRRCLAVGDTHGYVDRLEALLKQEGLLEDCPDSGVIRVNKDVEVVHLGDLGHYGIDTQANDRSIWTHAPNWIDVILWGNHDRAVIDSRHCFSGYQKPFPETIEAIKKAEKDGLLRLAHEAHGFLLTHAGLHASFKYNKIPDAYKENPGLFAFWLNKIDKEGGEYNDEFEAIRDAISTSRGGRSVSGGILWRDSSESLYKPYRQVFGHSSKPKVRTYQTGKTGNSYCVDVGDQFNGRLAGMWLPEERFVEVNVNRNETWEKHDHIVEIETHKFDNAPV